MPQRLDSLGQLVSISDTYLFPFSEYNVDAYNVTFANLKRNLNDVRSTGQDFTLGANSDVRALTINSANRGIGIGSYYTGNGAYISFDFEVAGTSGFDTVSLLKGSGHNQIFRFDDKQNSWDLVKNGINDFYISGSSERTNQKNIFCPSGGRMLLTDATGYQMALDADVSLQLYAGDKIRFSLDDSINSINLDVTKSGIDADSNLFIGYNSGSDASSGVFFGQSGAIFVNNRNGTTRIGNTQTYPESRLLVSNQPTNGTLFKTALLESSTKPDLYFRETDSSSTVSIAYNGASSLHFAKNKAAGTTSVTDPFILDLANKRMGIGGSNPSYIIDVTGTNSLIERRITSNANLIIKNQSNFPTSSGPVGSMLTTYSSGNFNKFLIGYDFQNEYFFFQTGNTSNAYLSSRNTHTFSNSGDIDIIGGYTSRNEFSHGKFLSTFYASSTGGAPTYINFNNANYYYDKLGNACYYNLSPMSGKVVGVDLICQSQRNLRGATAYLVFNKFTGINFQSVGGNDYVSGSNYFQIYDPVADAYKTSIPLSNNAYISTTVPDTGYFRLSARYNAQGGSAFSNSDNLRFNSFEYMNWVLYCISGGNFHLVDEPFTIATTIEYTMDTGTSVDIRSSIGYF